MGMSATNSFCLCSDELAALACSLIFECLLSTSLQPCEEVLAWYCIQKLNNWRHVDVVLNVLKSISSKFIFIPFCASNSRILELGAGMGGLAALMIACASNNPQVDHIITPPREIVITDGNELAAQYLQTNVQRNCAEVAVCFHLPKTL